MTTTIYNPTTEYPCSFITVDGFAYMLEAAKYGKYILYGNMGMRYIYTADYGEAEQQALSLIKTDLNESITRRG